MSAAPASTQPKPLRRSASGSDLKRLAHKRTDEREAKVRKEDEIASAAVSLAAAALVETATAKPQERAPALSAEFSCPQPCAIDLEVDEKQMAELLQNSSEEITKLRKILMAKEQLGEGVMPKKLLLVGPPGTGKTTAAKVLAKSCGMKCLLYKASMI